MNPTACCNTYDTLSSNDFIETARKAGVAIPAFNVPYLSMMAPLIEAIVDADSLAFIEVARLEWIKFGAVSLSSVMEKFQPLRTARNVRLHLDHVPVLDEDRERVNYVKIIQEALALGFDSVMVDGSRLTLEENIHATREAVELAHAHGKLCEAELGMVMGHESGPLPPYEELFASGKGFTDVHDAIRFVEVTRCDWLSVAVGNIHGAVSRAQRDAKKTEARLDLKHLATLRDATGIPLVLHGGTGIGPEMLSGAMKCGIAKINIGTETRQAYESELRQTQSVERAQEAVYNCTLRYLNITGLTGTARLLDVPKGA